MRSLLAVEQSLQIPVRIDGLYECAYYIVRKCVPDKNAVNNVCELHILVVPIGAYSVDLHVNYIYYIL